MARRSSRAAFAAFALVVCGAVAAAVWYLDHHLRTAGTANITISKSFNIQVEGGGTQIALSQEQRNVGDAAGSLSCHYTFTYDRKVEGRLTVSDPRIVAHGAREVTVIAPVTGPPLLKAVIAHPNTYLGFSYNCTTNTAGVN